MELIDILAKNLGVTEEQAKGGAGLILKRAKDVVGTIEFVKISGAAPEIDLLIRDLPATDNTVIGEVEKMFSIFGRKVGSVGSAAGLRAGFWKLGLNAEMIEKFQITIKTFVQDKGGEPATMTLEKGYSLE